jgi:UPF0271 protein
MYQIDLNSDLGESFGNYSLGMDAEVIQYVSSANIACGWHAGDPIVMDHTVEMAAKAGVGIGAHPGFPDLMGFGRRNMNVTPAEAKQYTIYQVGALMAFAAAHGVKLRHVKTHGAMYNMAAKNYDLARAICEGVAAVDKDLIVLGLANSEWIRAGQDVGVDIRNEIFADRAYQEDGTLVPRSQPGAVLHDKEFAIQRAIRMIQEHKVTTITGKDIDIVPDSMCVHGDNPMALEFVRSIRDAFTKSGIQIKRMGG